MYISSYWTACHSDSDSKFKQSSVCISVVSLVSALSETQLSGLSAETQKRWDGINAVWDAIDAVEAVFSKQPIPDPFKSLSECETRSVKY